jgi:5-formyltetrahydrofolate cyclo-ligase
MTGEKQRVRGEVRSTRGGIGPAARDAAARTVAARALALPEIADARGVLAYAATGEELDPARLVNALREAGARVAYPRVCGPGRIELHWCVEDGLAPGYCGILEPGEDTDVADVAEIDLALVPGVAFDEMCGRLGMGGGFYDRLLPRLRPDATAIGLAFDEQIVSEVPVEDHDIPLGIVVTPTRTLRRGEPRSR